MKKRFMVLSSLLVLLFAVSAPILGVKLTLIVFAMAFMYTLPAAIGIGVGMVMFFWLFTADDIKKLARALSS